MKLICFGLLCQNGYFVTETFQTVRKKKIKRKEIDKATKILSVHTLNLKKNLQNWI